MHFFRSRRGERTVQPWDPATLITRIKFLFARERVYTWSFRTYEHSLFFGGLECAGSILLLSYKKSAPRLLPCSLLCSYRRNLISVHRQSVRLIMYIDTRGQSVCMHLKSPGGKYHIQTLRRWTVDRFLR